MPDSFMAVNIPGMLSRGANNVVIALSEDEVGKLFVPEDQEGLNEEVLKMTFANQVNDLVVHFRRVEAAPDQTTQMLVMERLYPLDFRAYEISRRILWFDVFEHELRQLHRAGFVHRDLVRMAKRPGMVYDNILLTQQGLRLIDVGISRLQQGVGKRFFDRMVEKEWEEMEQFKGFFLNR